MSKPDIEQMLRECIPGGSVCDPQKVADDIRAWFAALSEQRAEPAPQSSPGSGELPPLTGPLGKIEGAASFLESLLRTNSRDLDDWRQDVAIAARTIRAALAAKPVSDAQDGREAEPVGAGELIEELRKRYGHPFTTRRDGIVTGEHYDLSGHPLISRVIAALAAAPQAAPGSVPEDARDAARYRWLRARWGDGKRLDNIVSEHSSVEMLDAAIDEGLK